MVLVKNEKIAHVPVLHAAQEDHFESVRPVVFFQHGFTSAKEHNLHYAYLLAEKGYRVILPDADLHGERITGVNAEQRHFSFWEIVINGINEIGKIKEALVEKKIIDPQRIGMVGTSMGGIMTLGALTQYPWIKTAVSLMGNPNYEGYAKTLIGHLRKEGVPIPLSENELTAKIGQLRDYDLSRHPERLEGRPLMFWHGQADPVVPFHDAYAFYESIRTLYKGKEDQLKFIADPSAGHKVSRAGVLAAVEWFEKFL